MTARAYDGGLPCRYFGSQQHTGATNEFPLGANCCRLAGCCGLQHGARRSSPLRCLRPSLGLCRHPLARHGGVYVGGSLHKKAVGRACRRVNIRMQPQVKEKVLRRVRVCAGGGRRGAALPACRATAVDMRSRVWRTRLPLPASTRAVFCLIAHCPIPKGRPPQPNRPRPAYVFERLLSKRARVLLGLQGGASAWWVSVCERLHVRMCVCVLVRACVLVLRERARGDKRWQATPLRTPATAYARVHGGRRGRARKLRTQARTPGGDERARGWVNGQVEAAMAMATQ